MIHFDGIGSRVDGDGPSLGIVPADLGRSGGIAVGGDDDEGVGGEDGLFAVGVSIVVVARDGDGDVGVDCDETSVLGGEEVGLGLG